MTTSLLRRRLAAPRSLALKHYAPALAACAAALALAACSSAAMTAQDAGITHDTALGKVLVDSQGMTVYTYDEDAPGQSHCYGLCAAFWPPVAAPAQQAGHDGFTVIARDGGALQWAYRGKPLYTYAQDDKPGDVTGDGADGVWHAAKP